MLRWLNVRHVLRSCHKYSSSSSAAVDVNAASVENAHSDSSQDEKDSKSDIADSNSTENSKIVAAAFASLREISLKKTPAPAAVKQIEEAKDVDSLLEIADYPSISRRNALKVISILADWAGSGRVKLADFETDLRFVKLCRILGRNNADLGNSTGDLSLVLGVTADDQAAKLVSSISLQQMVKVMESLGAKHRRSTPLLRSLSFNIGRSMDKLNIKEAADVLYACAVLNFPDEILIEKVIADICDCLKETDKPAVVSSIITSLGFLRYRNTDLLDELCNWIMVHHSSCRIREYTAIVLTLAIVNYVPRNFPQLYEVVRPHLNTAEVNNLFTWLDIVWSFTVLQQVKAEEISSVLSPEFLQMLDLEEQRDIAQRLKLLNINGYASLQGDQYTGPLIKEGSNIFKVPLVRTNEKQLIVQSVVDALSTYSSATCLRTSVNTEMGFLIDVECYMDSEAKLIPLVDESGQRVTTCSNAIKVAVMILSYHDMCRGTHNEPTGISALTELLVRKMGYRVVIVPYTEFNMREKLMTRVKYLETKLKSLLAESTST